MPERGSFDIIKIFMDISTFEKIIRLAWSKDTCYEPWQNKWNSNNPSKGQCYVTAKLFQELFGGSLIKAKDSNNISHYWNLLEQVEYDFTKDQYPINEEFTDKKILNESENNIRVDILKKNLFKKIFELENFPIIYEWHDGPDTKYPEHSHQGKVSFYVVEGSVTFTGGIEQSVSQYQRIDVPVGIKHTATVGMEGCKYIVGQEIEGDA